MSKRKAVYASKLKRATHLLFFKSHQKPGVKGWELHKALGADYPKVLNLLNDYLKNLDLQVKTVFEEETTPTKKPTTQDFDKARFFITLRGDLKPKEPKMVGWRIDDLAGLAIAISHIIAQKGQTPLKTLENLLKEKIPDWKASINIEKYVRQGYLEKDEKDMLYLGWRTRAEVDEKALIDMILKNENPNPDQEPTQ